MGKMEVLRLVCVACVLSLCWGHEIDGGGEVVLLGETEVPSLKYIRVRTTSAAWKGHGESKPWHLYVFKRFATRNCVKDSRIKMAKGSGFSSTDKYGGRAVKLAAGQRTAWVPTTRQPG